MNWKSKYLKAQLNKSQEDDYIIFNTKFESPDKKLIPDKKGRIKNWKFDKTNEFNFVNIF